MIALIGSGGMLGSMVHKVIPEAVTFDRPFYDIEDPLVSISPRGTVINCAGKIKPYCDDLASAIKVNALFPHTLPKGSIQIATDCVYTGKKGAYVESDPHDALDVYGKTKSLGEAPHIKNLRSSIIGPEQKNHLSLLDWFLAQNQANGFTNHLWNGITTYHFAKIVKGVIDEGIELPTLQHIVPADVVSKFELLSYISEAYDHLIPITAVEAPEAVDRTLSTENPELNLKLWQAAGYERPPSIKQMIEELASL